MGFIGGLVYGRLMKVTDGNRFYSKMGYRQSNFKAYVMRKGMFSCKYTHKIIEGTTKIHTTDLTSSDAVVDESKGKSKKDAWKKVWKKKGGWTVNPNDAFGPKLNIADF